MKKMRDIMGMTITVEIVDKKATEKDVDEVFDYFFEIDERFSPYKETSEVTKINQGRLKEQNYSEDMQEVLQLSEKTKRETDGYFDVWHDGKFDPSGLVKGWAIQKASEQVKRKGFENFFIDAGGDIQVSGLNREGKPWRVGIKNPFNLEQIVKVLQIENKGVATSGTYIRGHHVYNPKKAQSSKLKTQSLNEIVSLTVIGANIYEADRFATAAFAMGKRGIQFIEKLDGFEGYMIDKKGMATMTTEFEKYVV